MAIGPFTTYAPPGVYTRTLTEPSSAQLLGGLRVPTLIGTAQESLSQDNVEIIRGSSSVADTAIFNEDVSGRWVTGGTNVNPTLGNQDGSLAKFRVRNYPIVDGNGTGTATFEASKVSVTVNNQPVTVSSVDGQNGIVTLLLPTEITDVVLVSYYFKRTDTRITDDLSDQVTDGLAILIATKAQTYEVISGTSDTLEVFVNDSASASIITFVAGATKTAAEVANEVNSAAISGLSASIHIDNQGFSHVQLVATGNVRIGSGNANGALGYNAGDYTNRNKDFRVFNGPIVDGSNGGITTTDPSKVIAKVDGVTVSVSVVDGANSLVTLAAAPASGTTVEITYYFNTYQDTFDYLPNNNILEVGNVGIAPGRRDYLNGPDFIVINQGDQSVIQWGTAFQVNSGVTTGGSTFDSTQVLGLLVDNRIYATECTRYTDPTTNQVSTTEWVLPLKPTTGNGRDTPLGLSLYQTVSNGRIDLPTNRPDLVIAYVGKNIRDALAKAPVTVLSVDSSNNRIKLKEPVPADYVVFATFWYNTIQDDNYTLKVVIPGPSGTGVYTVESEIQQAALFNIRFGTKSALPQTVQFPSGSQSNPDAIHYGGNPVAETVTVTFSTETATHADFTNALAEPYDIYAAFSAFADVVIDGVSVNAGAGVDMATAFPATLVSQPVSSPTLLAFDSTDRLAFEIDGYTYGSVDISALTTLATVATAINQRTVIDLANDLKALYNAHLTQTGIHLVNDTTNPATSPDATTLATAITLINEIRTDYNAHRTQAGVHVNDDTVNVVTSAAAVTLADAITLSNEIKLDFNAHLSEFSVATTGNVHIIDDTTNLVDTPDSGLVASTITYGTEALLKVESLTTPATFQDLSKVVVRVPVGSGETDASDKVGFEPNLTAYGYINSLNKPAVSVSGNSGSFNITSAVNDTFKFNLDGTDYTVVLPQSTVTTVDALVAHINAGVASAADIATATAALVTLAGELDTDYAAHRASAVFHTAADVVNTTATVPVSLATSITFLNELKTAFNAHRVYAVSHPVLDTLDVVTSPSATDLPSAIVLANELKARYNYHLQVEMSGGNVHVADDLVNDVTSASVVFATPVAYVGTSQYSGKLALRSLINTVDSLITVSSGNANSTLGFTNNSSSFRTQADAGSIASALNADAGFAASAVAYRIVQTGLGGFLNIRSLTAGSTSTIAFGTATGTIFFDDTGIGIEIGVSGDTGEAAQSGYTVTSSDAVNGSSGEGLPGQTYTDARTGLRFTVLPASAGDYASGGSFTFNITSTFTTNGSIPTRAIPGLEMTVLNTNGMGVDTTAILSTYARGGAEPAIGDVYDVSYKYAKTDLSTALFRDLKKIQTNFGPPTPEFPLSLAARLALLNGSVLVGLKQVLRIPGQGQASATSYAAAIDEQKKPMPGNVKPDVIVPLTSDTTVFAYLNQHCIFMGSPRQEGERIGVVGTAVGTTPLGVQSIARGLASELMVVMYPDSYVITVTDSQGNQVDQVIDGSYAAAAMAGSATSPALDVATPWTRRVLLGFKRLGRILDPTEANQTAVSGVTVIEQVDAGLRIRQGLTTNLATVITRTPSVITTIHYVQQTMRAVLDPYIGQKFTGAIIKSVEDKMRGGFQNMIDGEIVAKVAEINAQSDEVDPTILRSEAVYVPVFPLEYIVTTLSIRVRI